MLLKSRCCYILLLLTQEARELDLPQEVQDEHYHSAEGA
jgi:hypothetical protein